MTDRVVQNGMAEGLLPFLHPNSVPSCQIGRDKEMASLLPLPPNPNSYGVDHTCFVSVRAAERDAAKVYLAASSVASLSPVQCAISSDDQAADEPSHTHTRAAETHGTHAHRRKKHTMVRPGLAASAALLLFSAAVLLSGVPAARAQEETDHEEEFSYSLDAENGPAHWGEIKEEWSACGKGQMQSPIDLASPRVSLVRHLGYLNHSYRPAQASIVNRGHDIMLSFEGDAGSVSINGTVYYLRQMHWHSPTEHSVNGRRYDLELHMVHQTADNKAAVIGVFYEIGAHDAFLHKLEPYLEMIAEQKDREEKVGVMDPRGARGRASVYYRYMGSLTTPPCSEGVVWTIVKRVRTVSSHQLELLREAVHDEMEKNARPRQEANNRDISMFRPSQQNKH